MYYANDITPGGGRWNDGLSGFCWKTIGILIEVVKELLSNLTANK